MIGPTRFFFLYFTTSLIKISSLMLLSELTKNDVIIEINKGYALRRIGAYSPKLEEQIVHTFVPLDNFCIASPTTDVCLHVSQSQKTNVVELITMVNSHHTVYTSFSYTTNNVSKIIRQDISRILVQHHPGGVIKNTKSVIHVINNQFYYEKNEERSLMTVSATNIVDNLNILQLQPTTVDKILRQINNNQIGFEYLSYTDLQFFLTAVYSTIDSSYMISSVEETLNTFSQLIVGQSIFALRYCSLSQYHSLSSQPCLAISTLFLKIPTGNTVTYSIYRLEPLPVIMNDDEYVYSDLPKLFGINSIDHTFVMWDDDLNTNECIFSPFVQCRKMPVLIPLSKSSCFSQLFDNNKLIASTCQVTRSQNIHKDIMEIDNGIWLFYNVREPYYCQAYSDLNELVETISIDRSSIVRMPCGKRILCTSFQISSIPCVQRRVIIMSSFISNLQNMQSYIIPIRNMSTTLVSIYQLQLQRSMKDVIPLLNPDESKFKNFIRDLVTYILSAICFILLTVILYIIKFIKHKAQKKLNKLENLVQDLILA